MESTTAPQQVVDTKWYVLRVVSGKERKVKNISIKILHAADGLR